MPNKIPRRKRPKQLPEELRPVDKSLWEALAQENMIEVWMSRYWTVQIYRVEDKFLCDDCGTPHMPHERLCITHAAISTQAKADHIRRDVLMDIKTQCGRAGQWAMEVYPDIDHGVNITVARHLYIFNNKPEFIL